MHTEETYLPYESGGQLRLTNSNLVIAMTVQDPREESPVAAEDLRRLLDDQVIQSAAKLGVKKHVLEILGNTRQGEVRAIWSFKPVSPREIKVKYQVRASKINRLLREIDYSKVVDFSKTTLGVPMILKAVLVDASGARLQSSAEASPSSQVWVEIRWFVAPSHDLRNPRTEFKSRLLGLPVHASLAFAGRCAMRARSHYQRKVPVFNTAIDLVAKWLRGLEVGEPSDKATDAIVDAAAKAGVRTIGLLYLTYNTATAAAAADPGTREYLDNRELAAEAAAAIPASYAADTADEIASIADLVAIDEYFNTRDEPIDISEAGPLGPLWADSRDPTERNSFDLLIDVGNANQEQITDLFTKISELNELFGGPGIDFTFVEEREPANINARVDE